MTGTVLLILFILLLLGSAFFSGAETALFSLSRARLLAWQQEKNTAKRRIAEMMGSSYNKTLIALVLGNMFVNSGLSMAANELMRGWSRNPLISTILSISVSIVLLLLIGEVTPKTFALMYAEPIAEKTSPVIYFLRRALMPLIFITEKIFSLILDLLGRQESSPLDDDEYSSYLDMAYSVGAFTGEETRLMNNVFNLRETKVNAVMKPRVDVVCIRKKSTPRKIAGITQKSHELFYPVIEKDLDDAESFISARDFYLLNSDDRKNWMNKATFGAVCIPENTSLTKALAEMKKGLVPVALVIDEYGGVTGLLKLKDIYEELIGDVNSEFEIPYWQVRKTGRNSWILSGNVPIQDIEDITDTEIEDITTNTLNGLFCEISGKMPEPGDSAVYRNLMLKVLKVSGNRIISAEIKKKRSREKSS